MKLSMAMMQPIIILILIIYKRIWRKINQKKKRRLKRKSKNPFAYFTQIIYYAFIRRIQKEKKQVNIKVKLIEDSNLIDMTVQPGDENNDYTNQFVEFLRKNRAVDDTPKLNEIKVKKRKRKEYRTPLEELL